MLYGIHGLNLGIERWLFFRQLKVLRETAERMAGGLMKDSGKRIIKKKLKLGKVLYEERFGLAGDC